MDLYLPSAPLQELAQTYIQPLHTQQLVVRLAQHPTEILAAQRLRYHVLVEKFGVYTGVTGLDEDMFDHYCDHLLVIDQSTVQVVGTYRILNAQSAKKCGSLYGEQEFNGTLWHELGQHVVELGRACVHTDYRSGTTLMLLWQGIVDYLIEHQVRYAIGYASVGVRDGGGDAQATAKYLINKARAWTGTQLVPKLRFDTSSFNHIPTTESGDVPSLIKAYVRMGAYCVGDAAWDKQMHTADFPMLLDMAHLDQRYAKHFVVPKHLSTVN